MSEQAHTRNRPDPEPADNNARLIAELQAVALGIHLVGLDRLPEVMRRATPSKSGGK